MSNIIDYSAPGCICANGGMGRRAGCPVHDPAPIDLPLLCVVCHRTAHWVMKGTSYCREHEQELLNDIERFSGRERTADGRFTTSTTSTAVEAQDDTALVEAMVRAWFEAEDTTESATRAMRRVLAVVRAADAAADAQ